MGIVLFRWNKMWRAILLQKKWILKMEKNECVILRSTMHCIVLPICSSGLNQYQWICPSLVRHYILREKWNDLLSKMASYISSISPHQGLRRRGATFLQLIPFWNLLKMFLILFKIPSSFSWAIKFPCIHLIKPLFCDLINPCAVVNSCIHGKVCPPPTFLVSSEALLIVYLFLYSCDPMPNYCWWHWI